MGNVEEKIKLSETKFKKALKSAKAVNSKIEPAQVEEAFAVVSNAVSRAVMNKSEHALAEKALILLSQALIPHYPPSRKHE